MGGVSAVKQRAKTFRQEVRRCEERSDKLSRLFLWTGYRHTLLILPYVTETAANFFAVLNAMNTSSFATALLLAARLLTKAGQAVQDRERGQENEQRGNERISVEALIFHIANQVGRANGRRVSCRQITRDRRPSNWRSPAEVVRGKLDNFQRSRWRTKKERRQTANDVWISHDCSSAEAGKAEGAYHQLWWWWKSWGRCAA